MHARTPRDHIALALDVPTLDRAKALMDHVGEHVGVFKIGLELFVASGPPAVRAVTERGAACFLDLKFHDIPQTVAHAVRSATQLGVRYLTLHTAAGARALTLAAEAAAGTDITLLGVTVLTSMADNDLLEVGVAATVDAAVSDRATLAQRAGLGGLVCSPRECARLRQLVGPEMTLVVPGIRPEGAAQGDQRRTAAPAEAIRRGADLLVIGRPIHDTADPAAAAATILREVTAAIGRGAA